jgi:hypothetical protein
MATATNIIADGGFESEGSASMTLSSWTKCSYPHPVPSSTKTPVPAVSPSAVTADIVSSGSPSFTVGPTPPGTPNATVSSSPHSGTYAALLYTGAGANTVVFAPNTAAMASKAGVNGICQTFVVPTNAVLMAYVSEGGSETAATFGGQEAMIFPGPISSLATATPTTIFNDFASQAVTPSTATSGYVLRGPYTLTGPPYNLTPGSTVTLFFGAYDSSPSSRYGMYLFVDDVTLIGIPTTSQSRFQRPSFRRF